MQRFLSADCPGDCYTRTDLDFTIKELVTLSILIAIGGADPEANGQMEGNGDAGSGRETLLDVVAQTLYARVTGQLDGLSPGVRD